MIIGLPLLAGAAVAGGAYALGGMPGRAWFVPITAEDDPPDDLAVEAAGVRHPRALGCRRLGTARGL